MSKEVLSLNVDSFLRLSELLGDWSSKDDINLEIPNLEGLDDAICLVNKACSMALWKKQEDEFDHFLSSQFAKIKQFVDSGEKNADKAKRLMEETANYYKRSGNE